MLDIWVVYICYSNLTSTPYQRVSVYDCINSCEDGQCELVFTGGSQGAGPATVASIVWRDYNPLVIHFGGVKALYRISPIDSSVCTDIDPKRHYRMVGNDPFLQVIDYIPYQWAFFADHIGHEIQFDGESMNYLGINPRFDRNPLRYQLIIHNHIWYTNKMREMYSSMCFPVASRGWTDGHWCDADEDCESELCYRNKCHGGFGVEQRCSRDEECQSKICNENVWRCAPASGYMDIGMRCGEDEDCDSGRCERKLNPLVSSTCAVQLGTDQKCYRDEDCLSGVCGGFLFRKRCWPEDDPNGDGRVDTESNPPTTPVPSASVSPTISPTTAAPSVSAFPTNAPTNP